MAILKAIDALFGNTTGEALCSTLVLALMVCLMSCAFVADWKRQQLAGAFTLTVTLLTFVLPNALLMPARHPFFNAFLCSTACAVMMMLAVGHVTDMLLSSSEDHARSHKVWAIFTVIGTLVGFAVPMFAML